jgi:hypothetical protein
MTDQERPDPELSMGAPDSDPLTHPDAPADGGGVAPAATPDPSRPPRASQGETPLYKGEPLDSERGPGLGCFWVQAILLGILLILTPVTVALAWPPIVSAALLILTLLLLLVTGQTVIFLLRLVAADKRSRRTPRSASARKTVGMLEDESAAPDAAITPEPSPPTDTSAPDDPS